MKHLTDNQIQSWFHSLPDDERERIETHLDDCPDCHKKRLLYEKLGDVFISASSNPIPNGFEKTVVRQLKDIRRQNRIADLIVMVVAVIGFALVSLLIFLTPSVRHIVTENVMAAWRYGCGFVTATEGLSDVIAVLAFGVTLLVFFAAIDRLAMGRLRPFRKLT